MKTGLVTLAFGLLCVVFQCHGVTIKDASVQGTGGDEQNPLEEGDELRLQCTTDMEWSSCTWTHYIMNEEVNGQPAIVVCSGSPDQNGATCGNYGGSHGYDQYAQRIKFQASSQFCGLRISDSDPRDTGIWACSVFGLPTESPQYSDIEVFVSNQSSIFITEPDHFEDPNEIIEYNFADPRPEIECTCTAYGGSPPPTFHWYIEDDRNEIDANDITTRVQPGTDELGEFLRETMTWTPTRQELCDYDLDQYCWDDQFTFNLLCKVEQVAVSGSNTFYDSENDQQEVQVMVEVKNGGSKLASAEMNFAVGLAIVASLRAFSL